MKPSTAAIAANILSLLSIFNSQPASAFSLSDLAGTWGAVRFETPAPLQLEFDPNLYSVTGIANGDSFSANAGCLYVGANGSFSGSVGGVISGSFSLGSQGIVNLAGTVSEGPISFPSQINAAADFLAGVIPDGESQQLFLAVKTPATVTPAELAGSWHLTHLQTPGQLITQYSTNGLLMDVQGLDEFAHGNGVLNFDAVGNVTGSLFGPLTGSYSIGSSGQITAILNATDYSFSLTFYVNASKDIMVTSRSSPGENYQEIDILTKSPATLVPNDLTGAWKTALFETPIGMAPLWNSFLITDISQHNNFRVERSWMAAGCDGFVTGDVGGMGCGTWTPNGPSIVEMNFTNFLNENIVASANLNAGRNTMVTIATDAGSRDLVILTKAPTLLSPIQDFGLLVRQETAGVHLYWAGDTGRYLQSSSDLINWSPQPNTTNQHSLLIPSSAQTNKVQFYRVAQ